MINTDKKLLEALIFKYGKSGVNLAINRLNEASSKINFSLERIGYDIGMYWIKNNNRKVGLFVFAENSDNIFYIKNDSEELLHQFENFFYNDAEFIDYGLSELYQRKKYYSEAFNDIKSFVKYMYGAFNRTEAKNFTKAIRILLKNDPQFEKYYNYKLYDYHEYE